MSKPAYLKRDAIFGRGKGVIPIEQLIDFYVDELELQSEFALRAYGEILSRVNAASTDLAILAFLQMFFSFAGNVSKLFFPSGNHRSANKERIRERSQLLRERLDVSDNSALCKRVPRNFLEHFDERMDEHIGNTQGIVIPRLITKRKAATFRFDDSHEYSAHYLRCFETERMVFTLADQEAELMPIIMELRRVQANAQHYLEERKALQIEGDEIEGRVKYRWSNTH